ncbi:MAG TPA: SulP family inorganic anion transporter [Candidatus Omnitrophota bacterium]|nr:SulP family inorganic anion transporter [Candidatus Omnitrophota bacterium]HPS20284.1 SulP family inorganic anion transporter [Candidatus Omnitrophota bacterium]
MYKPKLLTTLNNYSVEQFTRDLIAGIVVGVVAIPLAIAFAIASGVTPDKGFVTAIIAGFLVSALGGSRVQVGGPTGAFVVIIYGIVQKYGVDGLIIATIMAGLLLIIMGAARFGTFVKFIPHSVIVGFTSGIAMLIFSSQMKDFFGLTIDKVPPEFLGKWEMYIAKAGTMNLSAVLVSVLTVLIIVFWPKINKRIPGALIALILLSALSYFLHLPVETIGSRFGSLPHTLPMPVFPTIDLVRIRELFQPAFTIALLGAIESLLSAIVADGMIGGRHRSNTELIGQGIANIGSALFGGIPATGAIARTVTNIKNGGRTPIAGIVHAITVLLIMLFLGKLIQYVPFPCLAGILVVVAYHMSEWRSFRELLQWNRGGSLVLLTTFCLTVFVDLTAAIEVGVVLAAFIFMKRMTNATSVKLIEKEMEDDEKGEEIQLMGATVPSQVQIFEVRGPLFFGAANSFSEIDRQFSEKPKVRILRFRDVPVIDSTGMHSLKSFYDDCKKNHIALIITGLHVQPLNEMVKSHLYELIGEENVFSSMKESINRANELLKK